MFRFFRRIKENSSPSHFKKKKKGKLGQTATDSSQDGVNEKGELVIASNDPNAPLSLGSAASAFVSPTAPKEHPTAKAFPNRSDIAHCIKQRVKKNLSSGFKPVPEVGVGRLSANFGAVSEVPPQLAANPTTLPANPVSHSSHNLVAVVELPDPHITTITTSLVAVRMSSVETTAVRSTSADASVELLSSFEALPLELVAHIFSFLPLSSHDICNASAVCWTWRELIQGDSSLAERRRQHWRHVNWRTGRFYLRNTLPLKTHPIWQLLPRPHTKDAVFHYSGMDGTVQVLDLKSGELTTSLTLPSHNFPVMAVNESCTRMVISTKRGQGDFAIEEYDFRSGKLVQSISCHTGWITCLQFYDETKVVSGSQDHSIKLWDLEKGECEREFLGHSAALTCLQVLRNTRHPSAPVRLVSGSQEGVIKVWDMATGAELRSLACRFPILALHAENNLVAAAGCKKENRTSEKGCLKLWDWEKEILLRDLSHLDRSGKGMAPISGVFLSGSRMLTVESGWMSFRCRKFRKTGAIRLWDINSGALISKIADFRMREHTNKSQCVVSLIVDDDKNVIVGIEEMEHIKPSSLSHVFKIKSMVKVWSLKDGK